MSMGPNDYDRGWMAGHDAGYQEGRKAEAEKGRQPQPELLKVLFSRHHNDFLHVYEMASPPRVGETVALLQSPFHSYSTIYKVEDVQWTPNHTRFDVSVVLKQVDKEKA